MPRHLRRTPAIYVAFGLSLATLACQQGKPPQVESPSPSESSVAASDEHKASASVQPAEPKPKRQSTNPVAPANTIVSANKGGDTELPEQPAPRKKIFRPADLRQPHDDARLAAAGIRLFESQRLKLYTDIDAAIARTLPGLIDQLYVAWEDYLGPLPPDRAGIDFQMTGYLIRDMGLFRELGLVPDELVINHGRHLRNEFWMREQTFDYYRQHLLIHEATHCYMTFLEDVRAPVWYFEGMAEHFGTHQIDEHGKAQFRVMPTTREAFTGFDRITTIRDAIAEKRFLPISQITEFKAVDFLTIPHYSWSWALCAFLDGTPRYHDRFQQLSRFTQGSQFVPKFRELFQADEEDLATEWLLFAHQLQYGYDTRRAAIEFLAGSAMSDDAAERTVSITSDRGWQSSGLLLEAGHRYELKATGRITLADHPKPWVSEPQGISFRYFEHRPLGLLLGCIRSATGPYGGDDDSMLDIMPIGTGFQIVPKQSGTLYLRINDAWNSLDDNRGQFELSIQPRSSP